MATRKYYESLTDQLVAFDKEREGNGVSKYRNPYNWVWKASVDNKTGDVLVILTEKRVNENGKRIDKIFFPRREIVDLLERNCRHSRFAQVALEGVLARKIDALKKELKCEATEGLLDAHTINPTVCSINPVFRERVYLCAKYCALLEVFRSAIRYDNFYGHAPSDTRNGFNLQGLFLPNYSHGYPD